MRKRKVIVLGAGHSVPIGIPPMRGFMSRMEQLTLNPISGWGGNPDDKTDFPPVLKFWHTWRCDRTAAECDDLEAFFADAIENPPLQKAVRFAFARTMDLCMQPLGNLGLKGPWKTIYRLLAKDIRSSEGAVTVISFNPDILMDQAFLQERVRPEYCLPEELVQNVHGTRETDISARLLKPHGSINWLICDDPRCDKVTVKWEVHGSDVDGPGNWPMGHEEPDRHRGRTPLRFMMVLPEREKQPLAQSEWLNPVLDAAGEALEEAEEVFFVGYSAPESDKDVRAFLTGRLNRCRHAYVINRVMGVDVTGTLMGRYNAIACGRFPVTFFLGPDLGDVTHYVTSEWRKILLR